MKIRNAHTFLQQGYYQRLLLSESYLALQVKQILDSYGSNAHLYLPGAQTPVLGPELVVNGDFSNGTTGWSVANGGVIADVGGALSLTNGLSAFGLAGATAPTLAGRVYQVSVNLTSAPNGAVIRGGGSNLLIPTGAGRYVTTYSASTSNGQIAMQTAVTTLGASITFDDFSVREILSYNDIIQGFHTGNYLDSAGTTPATVDNPVGLVLDAAGSVGSELAPSLASSTGWSAQAGWTVSGGTASINSSVAGTTYLRVVPSVAGNTYRVTFTVSSLTSGSLYFVAGGIGTPSPITSAGTYSCNITANSTTGVGLYAFSTNTIATISAISIKEVTGIHASQSTAGYRPVERRGIVNLLTWSNDLTNAAWGTIRATKSAGMVTATETNASGFSVTRSSISASGTPTVSFDIKKGSSDFAVVLLWDGSANGVRQWFNLANGSVQTSAVVGSGWAKVSADIEVISDGYYRCTLSVSMAGTNAAFIIYPSVQTNGGFDCTLGDVGYLQSAGLFSGTLTASQILSYGGIPLTTTAAASSSLGNYFLQFDGTDDKLSLGSVPFQMADDFAVSFAGKVETLAALNALFGCYSTSANNPRIQIYVAATAGVITAQLRDDAGVSAIPIAGSVAINTPFVATLVKRGSSAFVRLNGVTGSTVSTASLGAATFDACSIGETKGAYLKGAVSYCDPIKGTVSDADILLLEKSAAQQAGVTL